MNKVEKIFLISHSTNVEGKEIECASYVDNKVSLMAKTKAENNTSKSDVAAAEKKDVCELAKNMLVNVAREKLFHVKMQIKKNVVTTIFDSGNQKNLISEALVQ